MWGPVSAFSFPGPNDGSEMNSVSCPALGDCVAVGHFNEYPPSSTYGGAGAAIEVNGVWGTATLISPPNAPANPGEAALTSVSCPNVGLCYAVGTDANNQPYVVEDADGVWGTAQVISGSGPLASIDCPAPNDCTAVGNGTYSILSNGAWNTYSLPAINMSSVSCVDATRLHRDWVERLCDRNKRSMGNSDNDRWIPSRIGRNRRRELHARHELHSSGE